MKCNICAESAFQRHFIYVRCTNCSYEFIVNANRTKGVVTNSNIPKKLEILRLNFSQIRYIKKIQRDFTGFNYIYDIGSGIGNFIYAIKKLKLGKYLGIEPDKKSLKFSLSQNLKVSSKLYKIRKKSIITMWHSIEHIPLSQTRAILAMSEPGQVIYLLSTPNSNSLLYRLWGKNFAFFDETNHPMVFSELSLRILFSDYGFDNIKSSYLAQYEIFALIQTYLNLVFPRNEAYTTLKRGGSKLSYTRIAQYLFVLALFSPIIFLSFILSIAPSYRACITIEIK